MALSQERVVRAAITLLDEVGLEGLTLRRLAGELGVAAPTLYWHVQDKRELLDLMAEAMREEVSQPAPLPGQPWWDWLAQSARAQWQVLRSHRDAALVVAGNRPTESSLPIVEETLRNLVIVGFSPVEALQSVHSISHYVLGAALEQQAEAARRIDAERDRALALRIRAATDLPVLRGALGNGFDADAAFEHGLSLLISGLRMRHGELAGTSTGALAATVHTDS